MTDSAPLPVSNQICLPSKTVTVPDCNNATGLDWQPPCPLDLQPEGLGHLSEISIRSLNDCANNNVVDENCPPVYVKDTSTKPKLDSATTTTMQDSGDKKASLLVGSCPPVPSLGELDTNNTCPPTSKQNGDQYMTAQEHLPTLKFPQLDSGGMNAGMPDRKCPPTPSLDDSNCLPGTSS